VGERTHAPVARRVIWDSWLAAQISAAASVPSSRTAHTFFDIETDVTRQRAVVDAFLAASCDGDVDALQALLKPNVVLRANSTVIKHPRAFAGLRSLGALDAPNVLALVGVGEAVAGGTRDRVRIEGAGKFLRLAQEARLFVERNLDLHLIASSDTGGSAGGVAQTEQISTAHDGHSAPSTVSVQGDPYRWSLACSERGHNLFRDLQPSHRLRRFNGSPYLHQ
jgi:hypothetical protein